MSAFTVDNTTQALRSFLDANFDLEDYVIHGIIGSKAHAALVVQLNAVAPKKMTVSSKDSKPRAESSTVTFGDVVKLGGNKELIAALSNIMPHINITAEDVDAVLKNWADARDEESEMKEKETVVTDIRDELVGKHSFAALVGIINVGYSKRGPVNNRMVAASMVWPFIKPLLAADDVKELIFASRSSGTKSSGRKSGATRVGKRTGYHVYCMFVTLMGGGGAPAIKAGWGAFDSEGKKPWNDCAQALNEATASGELEDSKEARIEWVRLYNPDAADA